MKYFLGKIKILSFYLVITDFNLYICLYKPLKKHIMKKITLLFLLAISNLVNAQTFTDHLVDDSIGDALSIQITDLDNDGDLDLVTAYYNLPGSPNTGKLVWYENDGSQNYTSHIIDSGINGAIYVAVIDANNDGKKDLLLNAYDGNALYLYVSTNTNPVTFLPKITLDAAATGSNYSVGVDLDEDGILDAVSANYGGGELAWYKWDGGVGVTKHVIDSSVPAVSSVEYGDMNGDGHQDLLIAVNNELIWYENDGTATFVKHTIAASSGFNGAITAYLVDFDGDSDLDIIGSASSLDEVAWFENDGTQTFTKHIVGSSVDYAAYGMATDFNNDGNLDIVVSATNTNELLWFENDGTNLGFTQHTAVSAATVGDAYAVAVNDIDADGDVDIALTSPGPNKVFWLENDFIAIPENDLIANAIPVSCGDVILGNTKDAINEVGEGNCTNVSDNSKDVWYTFTGNGATEDITLSTCSTNSLFNTAIAVYTGTPGNLSCLADNDDDLNCGNTNLSTVTFTSDGTSTYYIKVQGFGTSEFGQFELSVTCAVVATEDLSLYAIEYYPNPVTSNLIVKANEPIQNVSVFSVLGKEVLQTKANTNEVVLNMEELASGTYFVKTTIKNKVFTFKVMK